MVAAEDRQGKLGSELRHGTGKPIMKEMVLSSLVLLWKNVETALTSWASEGAQVAGCRCQSQFSDVEVGSLVVKRRCEKL